MEVGGTGVAGLLAPRPVTQAPCQEVGAVTTLTQRTAGPCVMDIPPNLQTATQTLVQVRPYYILIFVSSSFFFNLYALGLLNRVNVVSLVEMPLLQLNEGLYI